jgi:hypothetical protein
MKHYYGIENAETVTIKKFPNQQKRTEWIKAWPDVRGAVKRKDMMISHGVWHVNAGNQWMATETAA